MDGSSHPGVFSKITALEIFNFTRIHQCFVLRSLEFVCGRFLGEGQESGMRRGSSWLFYKFFLDFRNISFSEERSWLFYHCVFCDTLSVGC